MRISAGRPTPKQGAQKGSQNGAQNAPENGSKMENFWGPQKLENHCNSLCFEHVAGSRFLIKFLGNSSKITLRDLSKTIVILCISEPNPSQIHLREPQGISRRLRASHGARGAPKPLEFLAFSACRRKFVFYQK